MMEAHKITWKFYDGTDQLIDTRFTFKNIKYIGFLKWALDEWYNEVLNAFMVKQENSSAVYTENL